MQKVAEAWAAKLEDETLVAENSKIHNMEQKLSERELVADLQAMGLTEQNRRLLDRS